MTRHSIWRVACHLSLVAVLLSGCVKRVMVIHSDPPGATVHINGHEAGVTPLTYPFITHGRYLFTLSKPGFLDVTAREWVKAPWHQWIPLDFFTELLIPVTFQDVHPFTYLLQPATPSERMAQEPAVDVPDLVATLKTSTNPTRRRDACVLIARRELVEAVPMLEESVHDPDPEVRAVALNALRVLAGQEATPHLVFALAHDQAPTVRWQAAAELEVLKDPEALPALVAALEDRDALVRAATVEALRALQDRSTTAVISRRLRDPDIVVRRSAASTLGRLGDPAAAPALGQALRDPDTDVRLKAAASLRALKVPASSVVLARALRDPEPRVRAIAVEALREFGTPEAVPLAQRYLRSWQAAIRETAATALAALQATAAVPALTVAVHREPNARTGLAMAQALVALGAWPREALTGYEASAQEAQMTQAARQQKQHSDKSLEIY